MINDRQIDTRHVYCNKHTNNNKVKQWLTAVKHSQVLEWLKVKWVAFTNVFYQQKRC